VLRACWGVIVDGGNALALGAAEVPTLKFQSAGVEDVPVAPVPPNSPPPVPLPPNNPPLVPLVPLVVPPNKFEEPEVPPVVPPNSPPLVPLPPNNPPLVPLVVLLPNKRY